MTTNIRRSLGPIRSRLKNRIKETTEVVLKDESQDVTLLKNLRSKLTANINSHNTCYEKLVNLQDVDVGDKEIIETEIETSVELILDANEALHSLEELILTAGTVREAEESKLVQMKEQLEIEKLKLETDFKRLELENLKVDKSTIADANKMQKIKLPEIPLPTFRGKIIEWPSFWDSFKSTIHSNARVAKIDKFKYLMAQLEGDAKSTLCGFELTEGHYDQAIELLKERYDDSEHIIHHHYKILSEIPRCIEETTELRKTVNMLEAQIRSLQSMGESVDNNYMVSLFKSKLPEAINLRLEENRDTKWTLNALRKAVNRLVIAREKSEGTDATMTNNGLLYSAEGLLTNNTKIRCCFCKKGHWSDECQEFKTVKQRKERIRGWCFVCLAKTHINRDCLSKKPCFYCKEKGVHHSSLCPQKFGESLHVDSIPDPATLGEEIQVSLNQDVIMKTAKLVVYNPLTGRNRSLIALMDSGAKRTYLTEDVTDIIQAKCGPSRVSMLNTFSSGTSSTMITKETEIMIGQRDGSKKKMKVNVCKTITGSLVRQKVDVDKYRAIWNSLEMADDIPKGSRRFNIDLLIGNDYYDDIMKSEKIHLGGGLYLINSTLGWMFSGRVTSQSCIPEEGPIMLVEEVDIAKKVWELETIGVQNVSDESDLDGYKDNFLSTVKSVDGRYRVGLTWKLSKYELSDNYKLARARLKSVLQSVSKDTDSDLLVKYDEIIRNQLITGISEEANCTLGYLQNSEVVVHYIPHHMVKNENKLRIVYDGSAKTNSSKKSL